MAIDDPRPGSAEAAVPGIERTLHPAANQPRDEVGRWTPTEPGPVLERVTFLDAKEPHDDALMAERIGRAEAAAAEVLPPTEQPVLTQEAPPLEPAEPTTGAEAPAPAAPSPNLDSIEGLAQALEVDLPTLARTLTVPGANGARVPLAEVLDAWTKAPVVAEAETRLAARERELVAREQQGQLALQQRIEGLQTVIEQSYQALQGVEANTNWEQLKAEDPLSYTIKRQELIDREMSLRRQIEIREQAKQEVASKQQQQHQAHTQTEIEALFRARPEWRTNMEVATKAKSHIELASREFGIDAKLLDSIPHHGIVLALEAAGRQIEYERTAKPLALSKLANIPKSLPRPAARSVPTDEVAQRRAALSERHRKLGTIESAAAAIRELL